MPSLGTAGLGMALPRGLKDEGCLTQHQPLPEAEIYKNQGAGRQNPDLVCWKSCSISHLQLSAYSYPGTTSPSSARAGQSSQLSLCSASFSTGWDCLSSVLQAKHPSCGPPCQLCGRGGSIWLRKEKSWWQHPESAAAVHRVAVTQSLLALKLQATAPRWAAWLLKVLSSSPWHQWKLSGLAFICAKPKQERGCSLSASNAKLLTNFHNIITSQLIKSLGKALTSFYSRS